MFGALVAILSFPLLIVDLLGGIVSGIWLLASGEWKLVVIGIVLIFISQYIIALISAPGMFLSAAGMRKINSGDKAGGGGLLLGGFLFIDVIRILWCVTILYFYTKNVGYRSPLVPILIWAYGSAVGPWDMLANKDLRMGNPSALEATFWTKISFIIALFMFYFKAELITIILVFSMVVIIIDLISLIVKTPLSEQTKNNIDDKEKTSQPEKKEDAKNPYFDYDEDNWKDYPG
jgi:hypothetical protein